MHAIHVGRKLPGAKPPYPEGGEFNLLDSGPELHLRFTRPTKREIAGAKAGACEFALTVDGPILFFLYRFDGIGPWSDAPYSWHCVPPERRPDPMLFANSDQRWAVQVLLTDAQTALVYAIRLVSLSREFSRALALAVQAQSLAEWPGRAAYDRLVAEAYQRYPRTEDLLALATARCAGGA